MTDQDSTLTRALLVHIDLNQPGFEDDHQEFLELVASAGIAPVHSVHGSMSEPQPRYFVGSGKAKQMAELCQQHDIDIIIINHALSPSQERNLQQLCNIRVVDRIGLILDIFAQRAQSHEGKLQVELAQLTHLSTRLIRGWTHLERQKGGIGLRGPGETQLETDRRLIRQRIKTIRARLEKVKQQRQQGRHKRLRSSIPLIALVGYTNAGKSTLFNALTGSDVYAANKLFATLDPTQRRCELAADRAVVLSDTVGFIRQIPHDLIESFHATLQEVQAADLLLHVIDVNDPQRQRHIEQVNEVIMEIGAEHVPQLEVYNKIDCSDMIQTPQQQEDLDGEVKKIWISAREGLGLESLKDIIFTKVFEKNTPHQLHLPPSAGKLRARLFAAGAVCQEHEDTNGGWVLDVMVDSHTLERLCQQSGLSPNELSSDTH